MSNPPHSQKLPPTWIIRAINSFRTWLLKLNRKLFPGSVVLYEQMQYFWLFPCLYIAAKFDIATLLKEKPLTPAEIANRLDLDATNTTRLMRALASQGIFEMLKDGRYTLNRLSKPLLDRPRFAPFHDPSSPGPLNWNLMSHLDIAVKSGKNPFRKKHGMEVYEFLNSNPGERLLFDNSMTNLSELSLVPILTAYDFSRFPLIADIGGGEGQLLANILARNPKINGILFDSLEGLVNSKELLSTFQVLDRMTILSGDFFKSSPSGAYLYLLKNIIHNWGDKECVSILSVISKNMPDYARILIIEMVVPEDSEPSFSKLLDIQMMASMDAGRERTATEFKALIDKAGLMTIRIIRTISPLCLIEASRR